MKSVVVTGGTGFVGNAVIKEFLENKYRVFAIVRDPALRSTPSYRRKILNSSACHLVQGDITRMADIDDEELLNAAGTDGIEAWLDFAWVGIRGEDLTSYKIQNSNVEYMLDQLSFVLKMGGCASL